MLEVHLGPTLGQQLVLMTELGLERLLLEQKNLVVALKLLESVLVVFLLSWRTNRNPLLRGTYLGLAVLELLPHLIGVFHLDCSQLYVFNPLPGAVFIFGEMWLFRAGVKLLRRVNDLILLVHVLAELHKPLDPRLNVGLITLIEHPSHELFPPSLDRNLQPVDFQDEFPVKADAGILPHECRDELLPSFADAILFLDAEHPAHLILDSESAGQVFPLVQDLWSHGFLVWRRIL